MARDVSDSTPVDSRRDLVDCADEFLRSDRSRRRRHSLPLADHAAGTIQQSGLYPGPADIDRERAGFVHRLIPCELSGPRRFAVGPIGLQVRLDVHSGQAYFCTIFSRRSGQADGMRIKAHLKRILAFAGLVALIATGDARAEGPPAPADLVTADLVAESASIAPGTTLWLDVRLAVKPGWHVYWQNPGDSGLPTAIDWKLPPDFSPISGCRCLWFLKTAINFC